MIPIIFDKSEPAKASPFTSNGLGRLRDTISCTVTRSLDGSQYDLEMTYPVNGAHYDDIAERNYIYASVGYKFGPQPFRITKVSKPINGQVNVTAQHISYILKKTLIRPYAGATSIDANYKLRFYQGESLQTVLNRITEAVYDSDNTLLGYYIQPEKNNKFTFVTGVNDPPIGYYWDPYAQNWKPNKTWGNGTDYERELTYYEIQKPITVQEFLSGTDEDSINSLFGFKQEDNTQLEYTFDGFTVGLYNYIGTDTDIEIRYGKNMTDMTYETDRAESYGQAIAYYSGSRVATTIISPVTADYGDSGDAFGEIELLDLSSDDAYGYYLDNNDDDDNQEPNPSNAQAWAEYKIRDDELWLSKENVNISFIDLWKTEEYKNVAPLQELDIGDSVTVVYPDLGVNVTKRIQNETWDVLVDRYSSMTLGDLREKDLKDVIVEDIEDYIGKIEEYVEETNTYYSTEIARTSQEISLKADATTVSNLQGVVETNSANITINANNIESKVSKDGVISSINQSAESVVISADKVNIAGAAIFSSYSTTAEMEDYVNDVVDEIDLPEYLSDLYNDVGYQTSSGVVTIIDGRVTASYVNALGITAVYLKYNKSSVNDTSSTSYGYWLDPTGILIGNDSSYMQYTTTDGLKVIGGDITGSIFQTAETSQSSYGSAYVKISADRIRFVNTNYLNDATYTGQIYVYFVPIGQWGYRPQMWISFPAGEIVFQDADYTTGVSLSSFALKTWVSSNYATTSYVTSGFQSSGGSNNYYGLLQNACTKSYTTSVTSGSDLLVTSGAVYSHCSDFATQTWVTNKGYLTSHQSLSGYVNSISNGSSSGTWSSGTTHVVVNSISKSGSTISTVRYTGYVSDRRLKENFKSMPDFTKLYMRIRLVEFNYHKDLCCLDGLSHFGVIAQEFKELCDQEGMDISHHAIWHTRSIEPDSNEELYVDDGRVQMFEKDELHALHIQMIQKQQREIETLQSEVSSLRGEIEILKQMIKEVLN